MTKSRSELDPAEQALFEKLLALDEASRQGPPTMRTPATDELPVATRDEFSATAKCIDLLESAGELARQSASTALTRQWDCAGAATSHAGELPRSFGKFRLLRELGSGGFGVVFLALDTQLQREVALKLPRSEWLISREMHQRFLREARAAAVLDHPNIVTVYESGEIGGVCFVAFAYCEGATLSTWIRQQEQFVEPRLSAELVATLADAVQHAHNRGVLHRDLKPANIMWQMARTGNAEAQSGQDAKDDSDASRRVSAPLHLGVNYSAIKITDFGLARIDDGRVAETRTGVVMGTAAYMAPEQATGRTKDIGVHTDVYGLGTILYELLTGRPPFTAESYLATLRHVESLDPVRPRQFAPLVPRDLETICLKCLAKDWRQRYGSAAALGEDLRRFLAGDVITARPAGGIERLLKWSRRRPTLATAAACGVLLLGVLLLAGSWHQWQLSHANRRLTASIQREQQSATEARANWQRAEQGEATMRRHLFNSRMQLVQQYVEGNRRRDVAELLDETRVDLDGAGERTFAWRYWQEQLRRSVFPLLGSNSVSGQVAVSRDGRLVANAGYDGLVRVWNRETGEMLFALSGHAENVLSVAFSPDAHTLASGGIDGEIRLWSVASGQPLATLIGHTAEANDMAFSPDGLQLASSSLDGTVRVWDWTAAECRMVLRAEPSSPCSCVAYAPNGGQLVSGHHDGTIRFWNASDGTLLKTWTDLGPQVVDLQFDSAGERLAIDVDAAGNFAAARVWQVETEAELWRSDDPTQRHGPLAFFPDGRTLALIGAESGQIQLWNVEENTRLRGPDVLPHHISTLAVSADGSGLAVGGDDGFTGWWSRDQSEPPQPAGHERETWSVAYSPTGRWLASGGDDNAVRVWNAATAEQVQLLTGHAATVTCVAWSPNDARLATASLDGSVRLWDSGTWQELANLTAQKARVRCVTFSPDGRWLAAGYYDGRVIVWDVDSHEQAQVLNTGERRVRAVAFSPDGGTLAAASEANEIRRWSSPAWTPLPTLADDAQVWSLAFSPDRKTLAAGTSHGLVMLWSMETSHADIIAKGHTAEVRAVAFSHDGLTLVSAGEDGTIRLWDPLTGQPQSTLTGHAAPIYSLGFAPDDSALVSGSYDGAIKLWRAR